MKIIINVVLTLAAAALAVWLILIIQEPIKERKEFAMKKEAIVKRLENVREAQKAYKEVKNKYSDNWDSLINTIKNDKFTIIKTIGDPNDSNIVVKRDTFYVPIMDSIYKKYVNVDSLKYIPYTNGAIFEIDAGTINQRGVDVHVFQVTDSKPYNQKYIETGEQEPLTLGSMTELNTSGNWK